MEKLDPKIDGASVDIVGRNIKKLKQIFPDVFTEGKVDFDILRETLGDYIDDRPERYSFTWNGKARARRIAQTPSTGTLRPCPDESINWSATQNLFIEGDNLEVLKLLQKSYHKRIKMIYIDPPYNTGNEFIYPDRFQENIETYLRYTGQVDGEGLRLSPNVEASGRYHTNWLNMMLPRLRLARNLLTDDGIIFVSIDDNEGHNLRLLMNEVFGEENYLVTMYVQVRYEGKTLVEDSDFQKLIEQVVIFGKSPEASLRKEIAEYSYDKFQWSVREIGEPRIIELGGKRVEIFAPGDYEIERKDPSPKGLKEIWASGKVLDGNSSGRFFRDHLTGRYKDDGYGVLYKVYGIGDDANNYRYFTGPKREGATKGKYYQGVPKKILESGDTATKQLPIINFHNFADSFGNCRLEGGVDFRSGKKPIKFLQTLLRLGASEDCIICDFFAGSSSLAHAVIDLNMQNNSNIRFISVQLPEPIQNGEFDTISQLGLKRVKNVIEQFSSERRSLFEDDNHSLGVKVFKLDSSNIKPWDADFDNLEDALFNAVENIKPDRSEADVLYELLLKYGLDLAVPIEERRIAKKTVYIIGAGALIVCLAEQISLEVVEGIAALKDELKPEVMRVVFKDSGFRDDVVKTNAVQILRQAGIDDVKSL